MKYSTHLHRIIMLFLPAFLVAGSVFAQSDPIEDKPFHVASVVMKESQAVDQKIAIDLLVEELEDRGGYRDDKEGWFFLIGISNPQDLDYIALSVVTLYRLPEPVIQLGKEAEAFFLTYPTEKRASFSPEGKSIRESASEDFMRQFLGIGDHYIEIVNKTELQEGIETIVDKFIARNSH